MTNPDGAYELSITRTFNAPVDVVFGIWADREHMVKWWGPKDFVTNQLELDFRVGGAYRACIVHKDRESWMSGRFVEIKTNERIVFTFAWEAGANSIGNETLITVTFSEADGKTTQTFHQTPFRDADRRDNHVRGWTEVINREQGYAECVAKTKGTKP